MRIEEFITNGVFDYGCRTKLKFNLFKKGFEVNYIFDAYEGSEKINELQKKRFEDLKKEEPAVSEKVAELLKNYTVKNQLVKSSEEIFNETELTSILFTQEGDVLFLFDLKNDAENILAVKIMPEEDIGPQDVFSVRK